MATTSAIGRMMQEAQTRLAGAMARLSAAVGVPELAVSEIRYRDPAYEAAARWAALAEWAEALAERVATADERDKRLTVLRVVLQRELNNKTKAELEQFALDYGLALGSHLRKDEMVAALAEQLTGALDEPLAVVEHLIGEEPVER